jgi:hypothetical protein
MAKQKKSVLKQDKAAKIELYRDSKGRIRNAYKILPENQEALYKNKPLKVKPIFIKEIRKKKTKKENGKTKIFFETKIKYVDEKGKPATEKEFSQFNYLRELNKDNKEIIRTFQITSFAVFPILKNAISAAKTVTFKRRIFSPSELYEFIKQLRVELEKRSKEKDYPIFEVEEQENGNLIIKEVISEEEEEEEEEI